MGQEFLSALSAIGTFILIIAVFVGAYFVSKFVGKSQQFPMGGASSNLKVLERTALGKEQSLVIVEVAGTVLLLGVTAQHIEKLEILDPALLLPKSSEPAVPVSFLSILQGLRKPQTGSKPEEDVDGIIE